MNQSIKNLQIGIVILFIFSAFANTGCKKELAENEYEIMHDDLARRYLLYIPNSYDGTKSVPLLLNFHGMTSSSGDQLKYGDFRAIAEKENFIIALPQGTRNSKFLTYWNSQFDPEGVDDISFSGAMIDSIVAKYNINQKRIYSTGMSNGGFMSFTLACEMGDRLAAIASVAGAMTKKQLTETCQSTSVTPILYIHSTDDELVPYNGNDEWQASADDILSFWTKKYNCNLTPESKKLEDLDPNDESTVEHFVYKDCDNQSQLEHFKIIGGKHAWPGSKIKFKTTNFDINASEEIWRFFKNYELK